MELAGSQALRQKPAGTRVREARGRDKILAIARGLFAAHGFDAVSTKQLAGAAGLTIGALYHHFASKDEIYRVAVQSAFASLPAATDALLSEADDPEEQLTRLIGWFSATIGADTDAAALLRRELVDPHLGIALSELELFRAPQERFRELLGILAPAVDPELALATIVSLSFGLISLKGLHAIAPSLTEVARDSDQLGRQVARIVLRGIRA